MAEGGEITSYSTAIACIFCSATSAFSIKAIADSGFQISYMTFGPILVNGVIGIVRYGHPQFGGKLVNIQAFSRDVCLFFAVSALAGDLCLLNGADPLIAYGHLGISLIAMLAYKGHGTDSLDVVTCLALCSLGFTCFQTENYWAAAAGIAYFANHFLLGTTGTFYDMMPSIDIFLYGLCFFQYFSVKALGKSFF